MVEEFFNAATLLKMVVLALAYPLWGPAAKAMWQELQDALAPEGGVYGKREKRSEIHRAPGQDPWLNIPLASHRQRLGGAIPRPIEPPARQPEGRGSSGSARPKRGAGAAATRGAQGGAAAPRTRRAPVGGVRRRGF